MRKRIQSFRSVQDPDLQFRSETVAIVRTKDFATRENLWYAWSRIKRRCAPGLATMQIDSVVRLGNRQLALSDFLDGLAAVLEAGGYSLEWLPGAKLAYATWFTFPDHGTWLDINLAMSRDIAGRLAIQLDKPFEWYLARCDSDREQGRLSFEARQITTEGKVQLMPSTSLDDEDLEAVTFGKIEDRLGQILDALSGWVGKSASQDHQFRLFQYPPGQPRPAVSEPGSTIDEKKVQQLVDAINNGKFLNRLLGEGIVVTLGQEEADRYAVQILYEDGMTCRYYARAATVAALKARLNDQQRSTLRAPSIRPPSKDYRIPRRRYTDTEIDVRRALAELLSVDRFTVDIDKPLAATGLTREQFVALMQLLSERFKIPIENAIIEQFASRWSDVARKITIKDIAAFAYDKSYRERQWERK